MRAPALLALVTVLLGASAARAGEAERVVAVLYFDNNTNQPEYDVLKKGFADMMVTDLSAVPSLQVVERDRMESLLGELELQKSKYFDPKTAVKIGQGLGAKYAVTGAFAAFDPKLRIDIRMIEIATGKVVVADKVVGEKDQLFELQGQLVERFVAGLEMKAPPRPKMGGAPNVESLLEYSKSVDLADRGELADASERMKALVKKHPTFVLARSKQAEMRKRLGAAKQKREEVIQASGASLERRAAEVLAGGALPLDDQMKARNYLAYRVVRGLFLVRALEPHIATRTVRYALPGHEAEALRLLAALHDNGEALIREIDRYAAKFTQKLANGATFFNSDVRLPEDVGAEALKFGVPAYFNVTPLSARKDLAKLLLLGRVYDGKDHHAVGPVPASSDAKLEARGYALLDEAHRLGREAMKTQPHLEYEVIDALSTHADALLLRDRTEDAIGKLQTILDELPTSAQYGRIEKRIQVELGMTYDHYRSNYAGFVKAFETCEDMAFRKGFDAYLGQRVQLYGRSAIEDTVRRIETACRGDSKLRDHFWAYVYIHAGLYAGVRGDCALFDTMGEKYLAAKGSPSDLAAYRKNYLKSCK